MQGKNQKKAMSRASSVDNRACCSGLNSWWTKGVFKREVLD